MSSLDELNSLDALHYGRHIPHGTRVEQPNGGKRGRDEDDVEREREWERERREQGEQHATGRILAQMSIQPSSPLLTLSTAAASASPKLYPPAWPPFVPSLPPFSSTAFPPALSTSPPPAPPPRRPPIASTSSSSSFPRPAVALAPKASPDDYAAYDLETARRPPPSLSRSPQISPAIMPPPPPGPVVPAPAPSTSAAQQPLPKASTSAAGGEKKKPTFAPSVAGGGKGKGKGRGRARSEARLGMQPEEWEKSRRENHKEVERRRRLLINASISSLSSAVPPSFSYTPPPSQDTGDPGGGKTEALQRALAYVMWLKEENRRLREKAGEPAEDEEGNGVEGGEA